MLQRPPQWPQDAPTQYPAGGARPQPGEHFPEPGAAVAVAGQAVDLGKPRDHPTFGWDNEYGEKRVEVKPFEAGRFLVSNGQFHEFVKSGGYHDKRHWSEDGW